MKNQAISVAAVLLVAAAILFTVLLWPKNNTDGADLGAEQSVHQSEDSLSTEETSLGSAQISEEENAYGELLSGCISLMESGCYKLTVTAHRQIGGLSIPVTTVTYHGNGFINCVEYEGHDIKTEVLVNENGAYYLSSDLSSAYLLPADTFEEMGIGYNGLKYVESGSTDNGTSAYVYERYIAPNGQTVDYLFTEESLEKMKVYTGDVYDIISVSLSTDLEGARKALPENITVVDNR